MSLFSAGLALGQLTGFQRSVCESNHLFKDPPPPKSPGAWLLAEMRPIRKLHESKEKSWTIADRRSFAITDNKK